MSDEDFIVNIKALDKEIIEAMNPPILKVISVADLISEMLAVMEKDTPIVHPHGCPPCPMHCPGWDHAFERAGVIRKAKELVG